MTCVHPLTAYRARGSEGPLVFDIRQSQLKVPMRLPCGKCIGCRLERARQWGVRCLHEKKCWQDNSYVTLTYNDEFLPSRYVVDYDIHGVPKYSGSVCLRDVQLFLKRLRFARKSSESNPVRFFLGAEYGDDNGRPHYHALLFNVGFPDKRFFSVNKRGEPLYTSAELSGYWSVDGRSLGHCTVGEVTFDSAVYCAKYALKRLDGKRAVKYDVYDVDGVFHEIEREFACMSRRPGIGSFYYDNFGAEVRAHDNLIVNGHEVRPPRFYDTRSEAADPVGFAKVKRERKLTAWKSKEDNTPERLRVKEHLLYLAADKKERKL